MSDTPGAVEQLIRECQEDFAKRWPTNAPLIVSYFYERACAHDAEDAQRDADVRELWRVERQTAGQNEQLRAVLRQAREALADLVEWVVMDGSNSQIVKNAEIALAAIAALEVREWLLT